MCSCSLIHRVWGAASGPRTTNVIELTNPKKLIGVAVGGNTRHQSEYQGLANLKEREDVDEEDLILIHDGARPLLPIYLLDELIEVAIKYGASVPGLSLIHI